MGVLALLGLAALATAQDAAVPPGGAVLGPAQLDQLTAPIALYSDPLLGAVLAAATYPLEVVEAVRWLEDPDNAALHGDALGSAMQQQAWDPSVKSLVAFPDVLRMMNNDLQWTEQLGDAFLAQQSDLMDSVQRLRQRAAARGALQSNAQQTIAAADQDIAIEPAAPATVYVPYYEPTVVFAPWPWPDYPPYDLPFPPDIDLSGALVTFGLGIEFGWPWVTGYDWDWPGHGLRVGPGGWRGPGRPLGRGAPWQHDPEHRRGVPYRDPMTSARYGGDAGAARRTYRGYASEPVAAPSADQALRREPERAPPIPEVRPALQNAPPRMPVAPPAFESFGRGPQVHSEAARGSYSRSSMPAPRAAPGGFRGSPGGGARGGGGGRRP